MSSKAASVVFVADDLGVSPGANAGIARAATTVRETSLCVTGAAVEEGAAQATAHGQAVGLHLSFTLGRALTGPLRSLTDADGRFLPLPAVLRACLLRRPDRDQVALEVDAQLTRLFALVPQPSHLNGHHHVHVFPVIRDVVFAAAAARGIGWTRMPRELPHAGSRLAPARLLLARFAASAAPRARAVGLRWLPFVGLTTENRRDFAARAERLAARLPAGPCEWMVHPRVPDREFTAIDPRAAGRDESATAELRALERGVAGLVGRRFAEL
ncbi:MAG: ChbG/HpnK family deacetylase [Planctomycetota bacterium]